MSPESTLSVAILGSAEREGSVAVIRFLCYVTVKWLQPRSELVCLIAKLKKMSKAFANDSVSVLAGKVFIAGWCLWIYMQDQCVVLGGMLEKKVVVLGSAFLKVMMAGGASCYINWCYLQHYLPCSLADTQSVEWQWLQTGSWTYLWGCDWHRACGPVSVRGSAF